MKYIRKFNSTEEYEVEKDKLPFPNLSFALDKPRTVYYPFEVEDKYYDPTLFTGLGRKNLKKNIVDGVNLLTQDMFNASHTVYIIQFDYVLNSNIEIPNNSVLEFRGGSISGGSISLENTYLNGDVSFIDTVISGSCSNEILTPKLFGAVPSVYEDESNKYLHTKAFKSLANVIDNPNTLSRVVFIPSGHYSLNERVIFMSSCKVYGNGDTTVIDCYDGAGGLGFGYTKDGNHYYHSCEVLNCTIVEDAYKFNDYIIVNNSSELNVGDYIIITDTNDSSFNTSRKYYRTSEILKISNIEGNKIIFTSKLYGYYFADFGEGYATTLTPQPQHRTVISRFTPQQYNLSDFMVVSHNHDISNPTTYYTLTVCGFRDSVFSGVHMENHGNYVPWCLKLGIHYSVRDCVVRNYAKYTTDGYGLVISTSQEFVVYNCKFRATSHALSTGGGSSLFDVINRNFVYEWLYFENWVYDASSGKTYTKIDLDVHADAEYYKFINIMAPNSTCDTGGYNVLIENCKFNKISTSFNEGDLTIKNCEIFTEQDAGGLLWNNNAYDYYSDNSLVIENSVIHGNMTLDYQGSSKVYKKLVFKNNRCKSLQMRHGHIESTIIEDNLFESGGIYNYNCSFDFVSVRGNTLLNGFIFITSKESGNCIVNNNYVRTVEHSQSDKETIILRNMNGSFNDNTVIRDYAYYRPPISITQGNIIINNCIIKLNNDDLNKEIVASNVANVVLKNNVHNSTSISLIKYPDGDSKKYSYAFIDSYPSISNNLDRFDVKDSIGMVTYDNSTKSLAYISSVPQGNVLLNLKVINSEPVITENVFDSGKTYYVKFGRNNVHNMVYFSKTRIIVEEDLLCALQSYGSYDGVFQAPNKTDYPYVYITSSYNSSTGVSFDFYENRNVSSYDGAVFNVKRSGTTAQRPIGYDVYVGFMYFDTSIGKPIYVKNINSSNYSITWVDANGNVC